MSLLNDALRDLEKREHEPGGAEKAIPAGLAQPASGVSWFWPVAAVALIVLLAMAGGTWFWLAPGTDTATQVADASAPGLQPAPQPVIRPAPHSDPKPEPQPVVQTDPEPATDSAPEP